MRRISLLLVLLIIIPLSVSADVSKQLYTYRVEEVQEPNQVQIDEVPSDDTITIDAGEDFFNAISIPMSNGTGDILRTGTISTELNASSNDLFFTYHVNDTGNIVVELSSTVSTDTYVLFMDIFTGVDEWVIGGTTDQDPLPISRNYFSPGPGDHYALISGFNMETGWLYDTDKIDFTLTIKQLKQGAVQAGISQSVFSSVPFNVMDDIVDFFVDKSYILPDGSINLGSKGFDASSTSYYQGIASAVYGIVRAGDAKSHAGDLTPQEADIVLASYLDVAIKVINDALLTNGLSANFSGSNDLLFHRAGATDIYLIDNIYIIMALSEILFEAQRLGGQATHALTDYTLLSNLLVTIGNSLAHFNTTNGRFFETLNLVQFRDNGINQRGTREYLDSLALMAEVIFEIDFILSSQLQFDPLFAPNQQLGSFDTVAIRTEIETNLIQTTVTGYSLTSAGIGVTYWDSGSGKATTARLLGNVYYALNLNSRAFDGASLIKSSDLAINILKLFTDATTGLLVNQIEVASFGTIDLPKAISTLTNAHLILLMQRLQIKYEDQFIGGDIDVSRSWGRKAIALYNNLNSLMFDEIDGVYFGLYDAEAQVLLANPTDAFANRFVANAFINTILVRIFPVEVTAGYDQESFVDQETAINFDFKGVLLSDSVNWWDFIVSTVFQATLTIPEFGIQESTTINTADFFDFGAAGVGNAKSVPFFFTPTKKGNYTISLELSSEGQVLLTQSLSANAFGEVIADIQNLLEFSTDDDEFKAEFTLVDEAGIQTPNLKVNASLGMPLKIANNTNYVKSGRSDSSGKVSLTFDVSSIEKDNLVRREDNFQQYVFILLHINVTNAASFDLRQVDAEIRIEVRVRLARMIPTVSPSVLELTQGTTDSFSFEVSLLNQEFDPINSATIDYTIDQVPGSSNQVTTDSDGTATITLRDQDLFGLSDLAIVAGGRTNTTIRLSITHSSYPSRSFSKQITILPNSIKITANPVQFITKERAFFESAKAAIDVEVATEDLFGRTVAAFVTVDWQDTANNNYYNILENNGERRIAPATFSIDPSNLPAGEFLLTITAEKEGLTSTSKNALGLGLSQEQNKPVVSVKRIIVEENNLEDVILSGIALYGALILSKVLGFITTKVMNLISQKVKCPHCGELANKKRLACSNCGRDLPKAALKAIAKKKENETDESEQPAK